MRALLSYGEMSASKLQSRCAEKLDDSQKFTVAGASI